MSVNLIAAQALNRVIGDANRLPWSLPEDLRYFKALTLGHPVIMGRHTYESIGKPLKDRRNIVLSSRAAYRLEGCTVSDSLVHALELCAAAPEVFIIGGAKVYQEALKLKLVGRIYLTEIQEAFAGDAYFPLLKKEEWQEVSRQHQQSSSGIAFDFVVYDHTPSTVGQRRASTEKQASKKISFKAFMARQEQLVWG